MKITDHLVRFKGFAYHYTNANSLMNIIEGSSLFATNICFMNDSNEFWHSIQLAKEHVESLNEKHPCELYKKILRINKADIERVAFNNGLPPYYVISFTESSDSASFLERYGNFNLGVEFGGKTTRSVDFDEQYFIGAKVVYSRSEQKRIIDNVLQDVDSLNLKVLKENYWINGPDYHQSDDNEYRASVFYIAMQFLACWFKNDSYADEKEVRIVAYQHLRPELKCFRASGDTVIPYMPISIKTDWWEWDSILIGSSKYKDYQHIAINHWLTKVADKHAKIPEIKYSKAGHRLKIG